MDKKSLEAVGAVAMPQEGHYVVHADNLPAVLSQALEHKTKASIVGKTSKNPGAAFIVEIGGQFSEEAQQFFAKPQGKAGLSQALMDIVERRS